MSAGHYYKILKKKMAMKLHLQNQQHAVETVELEQISEENGDGESRLPKPEEIALVNNRGKLDCTLEQFYNGCSRRIKVQRRVLDEFRRWKNVEEILEFDIGPGWKHDTRIIYPGKGCEEFGRPPTDLELVLEEKPHPFFQREGNNLVVNHKISFVDSLTGKTLHIKALDGRDLTIEVKEIVEQGHIVMVPNEGMPLLREPGKKGDLYIKFDVVFPSTLTLEQKDELKVIL